MPDIREKLIALLDVTTKKFRFDAWENTDRIANFLISNGVTIATDNNDGCKWIPVSERLPNSDKLVLVIADGRPTKNIELIGAYELAEYDPEGWILEMWPEWMGAKVTHWMPLPQPPKEDE